MFSIIAFLIWLTELYIYSFFLNETATTDIYTYLHTLSLHDALPIYLVGLLVGRGDQLQRLVQALGIQSPLVAPGHLAHHQADQHALARGVHEAVVPVRGDFGFLALAAGLLDGLLEHRTGFVLDQLRRHLHVLVGRDQLLADGAAQAIHQRALELALQVAADVGAELLQLAALDAEAADERLVGLGQHLDRKSTRLNSSQ